MQLKITQSTPELTLSKAVLLYGSQNQIGFVTIHDVDAANGRPVIREGEPATLETLRALFARLQNLVAKPLQYLPENVIACNDEGMAWWEPAEKRRVYFHNQELGERTAIVPHPPLLFVTRKHEWAVLAMKDNRRPAPATALYLAPYFNVWRAGKICTGSAKTPGASEAHDPALWSKAFFDSAFTHPNIHGKNELVNYETGPYAFWKDMLDGKFTDFPMETLVPTGMTLGKLLGGRHEHG